LTWRARSRRLVCGMKSHSNGPFVVYVDVGGARITEYEVLEEHAQVESFFGGFGAGDVFAFLSCTCR
jgi:hypothetical protein